MVINKDNTSDITSITPITGTLIASKLPTHGACSMAACSLARETVASRRGAGGLSFIMRHASSARVQAHIGVDGVISQIFGITRSLASPALFGDTTHKQRVRSITLVSVGIGALIARGLGSFGRNNGTDIIGTVTFGGSA